MTTTDKEIRKETTLFKMNIFATVLNTIFITIHCFVGYCGFAAAHLIFLYIAVEGIFNRHNKIQSLKRKQLLDES